MNTTSLWRPLALFILALITLGAAAPRAGAQVNDLEPFWVVLTRDTDRSLHPVKNTDLVMRAQMGQPGTQLFVSIHVNAVEPVNASRGFGIAAKEVKRLNPAAVVG